MIWGGCNGRGFWEGNGVVEGMTWNDWGWDGAGECGYVAVGGTSREQNEVVGMGVEGRVCTGDGFVVGGAVVV